MYSTQASTTSLLQIALAWGLRQEQKLRAGPEVPFCFRAVLQQAYLCKSHLQVPPPQTFRLHRMFPRIRGIYLSVGRGCDNCYCDSVSLRMAFRQVKRLT
jgi:hypothetical protein